MLSKVKKMVSEPKVYALMVESAHGQVLHLGVHFTLEEAYSTARRKMESLSSHTPGEAMDIDLWSMIPARQLIAQLLDPSSFNENSPKSDSETVKETSAFSEQDEEGINQLPESLKKILLSGPNNKKLPVNSTMKDHIQEVKEKKNRLMKKLIVEGDVEQVEKLKDLLGPNSRKYVLQAIKRRNLK